MIRTLKFISRTLLSLLVSVLILISALFALIQTDFGKTKLRELLITQAAEHNIQLTMDPIKGRLPFRFKVSNIEIKTTEDLRVSIYKMKGRISFFSLLKGEIFFKSLKLFHFKMEHPSFEATPSLSVLGKGKWIYHPSFLGLNVKAILDADPKTHFSLNASWAKDGLHGDIALTAAHTEDLKPLLDLPVNGPATFKALFEGSLHTLNFREIDLHTPLGNLQGEMTLSDLKAVTKARSSFQVLYPFPLHGALSLNETHLEISGNSKEFKVGTQEFSSSHLSLIANKLKVTWEGNLHVNLESETLPVDLTAKLSVTRKREIALNDLYVLAPETEVGGKLFFHFPDYTLDGALFAQAKDLSHFRKLWPGSGLKGQCGGEITFASSPIQNLGVYLSINRFQYDEFSSKNLVVKLKARDLFTKPKGFAEIDAEGVRYKSLNVDTWSLRVHSEKERWPFEMLAKGAWEDPLEISLKGSFFPSLKREEITIDEFYGDIIGRSFKLEKPFTMSRTPEIFTISECLLNYTGGWLKGECSLSKERSEIVLKSEHFPLELFSGSIASFSLAGGAAIDLKLSAKDEELQGHFNLLLEQVRLFQFGKHSPLMTKGSLLANVSNNKIQLHAHLLSSGHQFFIASATIPITFSRFPLKLKLERDKPVAAQVFLDGRVEEIFDFLNLGSQEIKGHVMGQAFLSNTLNTPKIKGSLRMNDGSYENYTIGTSIKDVHLDLMAANQMLTVRSASAQGPKGGVITGSGQMELRPSKHFPFHFETHPDNITGLDFDMVSARVSGGPLFFDGSLQELLIHGKVAVTSADFKIPDELPVDIPDYPVTLIHPPAHLDVPPSPKRSYSVRYDLKMKAQDHVMVHGRGLNSEWKGKAHIKGEGADFTGEGNWSLIRGEFDFSGKRFSLTKGEITFSESGAQIDLRGNLQVADATITAVLTGSLTAPSLTFQSIPAMPTSSILARLIFNKDMSEISPFQAIQLAQMIVTLSGDTGPNVLEKIRKSLGVDRFNIVSGGATGDEISLQIGKYLAQGVMITLAQSAHSSQVIVEVELKGGFILQAETQEEEEGKFSLKWNHNY